MAADHFFFSSLEARSLSFPCCNQSLFYRFRFPALPFHSLRLSAANPKFSHQFVSRSSNSNSDAVSADLYIISTNECSDGSVIFRFGNASELAITNAEKSQSTSESANVNVKDLDKEDMSSTVDAVDVSDGESEVGESVSKKVGRNLKVKSQPKRKARRNTNRVSDVVKEKAASVVGIDSDTEKSSVDSSKHIHPKKEGSVDFDDVVKVEINNAPKGDGENISETEISTQLASSESSSKIEVPHGVKSQEERGGASEENGENVGKIEGNALNVASKMDIVPDVENSSPTLATSAVESEITTELASLESSSESEVTHGVKFQEENSVASNGNGETIGKIEGTTLNSESKMDSAVEEVHAQVAASKTRIKSEIKTQSTSLGASSSNIEVPHSLKFPEVGKDDRGEEVADLFEPSKELSDEHSINASKMLVMIEDANEDDVGKVKLNPSLSEVESTLNEAKVHKTLDESVDDDDIVKISKMSDGDSPFSVFKEEITEAGLQSGNKVRLSNVTGAEVQSNGTTLERGEISTAGYFLYSGAALLPNPTKAFAGGEDAYFIASQNWLGVADGVGQWSLEGTCVGLYAKELMEYCEKIVSDRDQVSITDPVEVLNRAAANTQSSGSSTALVAYFDDRALHVANIGDSGFMILRNGTVFKRSSPMVYEFNFPVRIERGDNPSDFEEVYRIDLYEGDVIIAATDGLFDNLYEQDIASVVFKSLQESLRPQEIAELLATRAQEVGQSSYVRSPFADEAQATGYVGYRGGKLDDVTVIVSLVKRRFSNHVQSYDSHPCGARAAMD